MDALWHAWKPKPSHVPGNCDLAMSTDYRTFSAVITDVEN